MNQSNQGGCWESLGGKAFLDLCETTAAECGIASGQIILKLTRGSVVRVDVVWSAKFRLTKNGNLQSPPPAAAMREIVSSSQPDLCRIRDAFDCQFRDLIFDFGSLTIDIEDGQVSQVIPQPTVRRTEIEVLDILFGRWNRPDSVTRPSKGSAYSEKS